LTTVHTLASGSSGNALLLSCGGTHLLIDAGISCRRITASLAALGLAPADLSAVLITHIHGDHIAGLQTLLKRTELPIWATGRTCRELNNRFAGIGGRLQDIPLGQPAALGSCSITAFPTSHDAPGSCGYRVDTDDGSVGVLTDSGYVTDEAAELLPGVDLAVLEANHDVETLRSGPYPYYLKQRVLGREGHLCNEDAARFAVTLAEAGAAEIVLAHLSRENNTPAMAAAAVETALSAAGLTPVLSVAPRDTLSGAHTIPRRAVCRK
jgi:phosphoribosyl 1,2-cyclic phosphodiesterase